MALESELFYIRISASKMEEINYNKFFPEPVSRIGDPVFFLPLDPGSGMKKKIWIRNKQLGSYFRELSNLVFN
jgi:hypothetical protein